MITSVFVRDILDRLLDGDEEALQLRKQVPFLGEEDYEYTGHGVFVGFHKEPGIEAFALPVDKLRSFVFDGITVKSPQLEKDGAMVMLHVKDGLINYLEVWAYWGDYPREELKDYQLVPSPPANYITHTGRPPAPLL